MAPRTPVISTAGDPASLARPDVATGAADAGLHGDAADALALYRAIFANNTDAIAVIDPNGRYLDQNAAHARLLGYSAAELQGKTPAMHLGEEVFAAIARELATTGRVQREVRSTTRGGAIIDLELSAFAVDDRRGAPLCFVSIERDITDRKRAAEEVARRVDQLESLYRMADAVAQASDLESVYEEALTGLQRTLVVERTSVLLVDPDGVMRFKAWRGLSDAYRAAVEGHSPWSADDPDPRPIHIEDIELDAEMAPYRAILAAEDIRGLTFLPLITEGRLLGKFMLYFREPRPINAEEMRLARTLASHIAVSIGRRRTELAMRESEERYRRLVEVCPDGVMVHSDGRIVFANPAAARLLGAASPDELFGMAMLDIIHPDYHSLFHERTQRLGTGETTLPPVVKRLVRTDGTTVEVEISKIVFMYQHRQAVQLVIRDITERRRVEEARHLLIEAGAAFASSLEHETTLRSIARIAVPAFADWCFVDIPGDDGGFRRVAVSHSDPAQEELAHALRRRVLDPSEHAGGAARVIRTGHSELVADVREDLLLTLAGNHENLGLFRAMDLVSWLCVPLTARGRILGAISFGTAASGRRYSQDDVALAEELAGRAALAVDNARLYLEAREANRAKSSFLATMSHELRTPLNAIAGYAELLELGVHGPLTDDQRGDLDRIRINQRHLLGLISDVLSFAKLETGRLEFAIVDIPVESILAAARAHVEPQIQARGLRYEHRSGEKSVTCRGDADKLQQIVVNLLSNAVKFTPGGGSVTLDWEASDDRVGIHVRDTGRGIPPGMRDLIFDPFVQLDTGLSARMEGTGLGLAISRELARAMGGDIFVESAVGEGSTFTVTLPRR